MNQSRFKNSMVPSCSICLKGYDTYYHTPRVLPKCGHTYCEKCIKSKLTIKRGRQVFTCLDCNSETQVRKNVQDELPKNITIADLVKDAKFRAFQETPIDKDNQTCLTHNRKLEMICLKCDGLRVCSHCVIFGVHKGHEVTNQVRASKQDMKELQEFLSVLQDTINHIMLPQCPQNVQKQAKKKLTSGLQSYIKDSFKEYYSQITKRQQELLTQCEALALDEKGGDYVDDILNSFDLLRLRGSATENLSRKEVQQLIDNAKDIHNKIEGVVQSFNKTTQNYLTKAKAKLKQTIFFYVEPVEKRNLKAILSPNTPKKQKQDDLGMSKLNVIENLPSSLSFNWVSSNEENPTIKLNNKVVKDDDAKSITIGKKSEEIYTKSKSTRPQLKTNRQSNLALSKRQNITNKIIPAKKDNDLKSPSRTEDRDKSPIFVLQEADLKYIKLIKQVTYELRPKLQIITSEIDRQQSLGTLELIGMQVCDQILPYICEYLIGKKLKFSMIKLVKNQITDEGFRILLSYLRTDNFTKVLNVTSNQLTQKSLQLILKFIQQNNILKTIYISHNKINSIQLKRIHPQLDNKFVQVVL